MIFTYDPAISSTEYHAMARHQYEQGTSPFSYTLRWMLDEKRFAKLVNHRHITRLTDPSNWSDAVKQKGVKPRIVLEGCTNQSGSLQLLAVDWLWGICFTKDFTQSYFLYVRRPGSGSRRPEGEAMWVRDYEPLLGVATFQQCPVARMLLFAVKAKIDEVTADLKTKLDVLGSTTLEFVMDGERLTEVEIVPSLSRQRYASLRKQARDEEGRDEMLKASLAKMHR